MHLAFYVTKQDYIDAIVSDWKTKKIGGTGFATFFGLCILLSIPLTFLSAFASLGPKLALLLQVLAVLLSGIIAACSSTRKARATRIINRRIRTGELDMQLLGPQSILLEENGYRLRYGSVEALRYYAGVQRVADYPLGVLIYHSTESIDLIPARAFAHMGEKAGFVNWLQTLITRARDVGVTQEDIEARRQGADFVLEYTWAEEGFTGAMIRASRLIFATPMGWTPTVIGMTLIGLLLLSAVIWSLINLVATAANAPEFYGLAIFLMLLFALLFLSPLLITFVTPLAKRLYRTRILNGAIPRDYFQPQALLFANDRITEMRRTATNDVMYDKLAYVKQDADGMYLLLKGSRVFVIPEAAFTSPQHKQAITAYLEDKMRMFSR